MNDNDKDDVNNDNDKDDVNNDDHHDADERCC